MKLVANYMSKAFSSYIDSTAKTSYLKNFVLKDEEAAGVNRTSFLRSKVDVSSTMTSFIPCTCS